MLSVLNQIDQVLTVAALEQRLRDLLYLLCGDEPFPVRDLFYTRDTDPLPLFDHLHELSCLHERIEGSRIQPGRSPVEYRDSELSPAQVFLVDIGDLIFAAGGWLQMFGNIHHGVVIEIQAGYGIIALRFVRFLFDRDGLVAGVEFDNAVPLRIADLISIYDTAVRPGVLLQLFAQSRAVKYVISQHEGYRVLAYKRFAYHKCLRQPIGLRLLGVGKRKTKLRPVAE